jgi:uncharacterized membrane protein YgcG
MKRSYILALLLLSLLGIFAPSPRTQEVFATAGTDCNALVLDGAHVLSGPSVLSAAQRLQRLAGDVRVRTIETFAPFGTIDQYEANLLSQCPSWQATDGGMKNNLVVVMMSLAEHKTGIYYGSQWGEALDSAYLTIQTDSMNPRFRDGDFTSGMTAGLNALRQTVNNQLHPQPVTPQQVADYSWIGKTILAIVGIALVWWLLLVGTRALPARYQARARRRASRQEAQQLRNQLQTMVLNLDPAVTTLHSALDTMEEHVDPQTFAGLRASVQQLRTMVSSVTLAYGTIDLQNPDRPVLSELEYRQMATAARTVLDQATAALRLAGTLSEQLDELRDLLNRASELLTGAQQKITAATAQVASVTATGLLVPSAEPLLSEARTLVSQAVAAQGAQRRVDAGRLAKQAGALAEQVMLDAATLRETQRALAQEIRDLRAGADEFARDAQPRFARAMEESASNGRTALQSVEAQAGESRRCLEQMRTVLIEAEQATSLTAQDWERAKTLIADAKQLLHTARGLIQSTEDLLETLRLAKTALPGAIAPTLREVENARLYIEQHPDGISVASLNIPLKEATQKLLQLQADLTERQPDYLRIDSALKETSAAVADILKSAKRQHATAEETAKTQAAAYGSGVVGLVTSFFEPTSESSTGLGSAANKPHWTSPNSGGGSTASSGGGGGSTDWGSSSTGGGSTSW